jgi:predicted phage terminase large subunit-like protein
LQYVDCPGYHALILRRTFAQLAKPDALMDLAHQWLNGTDAHWNGQEHKWTFPSGATLTFGHMEHEQSKYDYQGAAYSFVAYDELTQFTESQYLYLFSRLRRKSESAIPIRMRAASNPGGVGHDWVKQRFIRDRAPERIFLRAKLADNPSLDQEAYIASLSEMDPLTKAQLLAGDWDAFPGGRFQESWFQRRYGIDARGHYLLHRPAGDEDVEPTLSWIVTVCDPAATAKERSDYTAIGTFLVTIHRDLLVLDVVRKKLALEDVVPAILAVCRKWKPLYVGIEATGFSWGIVHAAKRTEGIPSVRGLEPGGKGKLVRATPAIVLAESGRLWLPESAPWVADYIAEHVQFTGNEEKDLKDANDDQCDVTAWAVQELDRGGWGKPAEQPEPEPARSLKPDLQKSAAARRKLFGL